MEMESNYKSNKLCRSLIILLSVFTVTMSQGNPSLNVVWMTPFETPDESNFRYNASTSVTALAFGIETVKHTILPNHQINITIIDSKCSSKESVGKLVDLLFHQSVDAVIGPPCAKVVQPIGELLAYRNIPLLNWVSAGQTFDDKEDLSTYIRLMSPVSSLGGLMVNYYYQFKWRRLIMISTMGDKYEAEAAVIEESLKQHVINNYTIAHHYSNVQRNATDDIIDAMFSNIKHEGRIIILVIPKEDLRQYMIRAFDLGMATGDYQFLFTATELEDHKDSELLHSDRLWRANDGNDHKARQGFENVLYFVLGHSTVPSDIWRNGSFEAYDRVFGGRTDVPVPLEPDEYSPYLHDAIVMYAYTVNVSLKNNFNRSGLDLFRFSSQTNFKGLSGDVVMNLRADRQPSFFMYDLDSDGTFKQAVNLRWTILPLTNKARMNISLSSIVWGDGRTSDDYYPPDVPLCGFFNEKCPADEPKRQSYEVIIGSVSGVMLVVLLVLFLIYRWQRGVQGLKSVWKINYEDLNFNITRKGKTSASGNLSTRSIPSAGTISCGSMRGTILSGSSARPNVLTRGQIFTTVALYKGEIVAVKRSRRKRVSTDRGFTIEMRHMLELKHTNLTNFLGVCTTQEKICSVWEYCNKGSIQDVIENDEIRLDTMFKLSLAIDICQGLEYIHKSHIKYHGKLQSSNCVIDSRWVCKLTDFGLRRLSSILDDTEEELGEHAYYARLFWMAPEILRQVLKREQCSGTQAGDIYALGIILKEILCRNEPYSGEKKTPKEIIDEIASPEIAEFPFRPIISDLEVETEIHRVNLEYLIRRCWAEDIGLRPSSKAVLRTLNKINPYKKASVVDNMIVMMEKYTNNLEEIVADRTEQLQEEKRKTDQLLYRMLPRKVADDLKFGRSVQAEAFDSVTIYFSDIVQFTTLAGESTPLQIVELLNALYTMFDDIIGHYDVYKVETIGDAYMIVSGLPEKNGTLHVREISYVALSILQHILTFKIPHKPEKQLEIRIVGPANAIKSAPSSVTKKPMIKAEEPNDRTKLDLESIKGLHTGSVVAGVVGLTMPRYCLFGDTVNTASRMESNGKAQRIHISPATKKAIDAFPKFLTEERGEMEIKGKGFMTTYWLTGLDDTPEETEQHTKEFIKLIERDNGLDDTPKGTDQHTKEFTKLIEPDNKQHREDSDITDHIAGIDDVQRLKVTSDSEGKVSVADSGIVMDRAHDEDKHTPYTLDLDDIGTGSDESSSSDGLIFIKEGLAPGHTIHYDIQRSESSQSIQELRTSEKDLHRMAMYAGLGKRIYPSNINDGSEIPPACKSDSLFLSSSFRTQRTKHLEEPERQKRNSYSYGPDFQTMKLSEKTKKKQRHSFSFGQKLFKRKGDSNPKPLKTSKKSYGDRISKKENLNHKIEHSDTATWKDINKYPKSPATSSMQSTTDDGDDADDDDDDDGDDDDVPEQIPGLPNQSGDYKYDPRTKTTIFTIPHRLSATDYMAPQNNCYETDM